MTLGKWGAATSWQSLERRLLNVIICVFKLRNFETSHSDSATKRLRWRVFLRLARTLRMVIRRVRCGTYINTAWRGPTALLILDWGQCEGLNTGMGRSRNSHAFFVFHTSHTDFWPLNREFFRAATAGIALGAACPWITPMLLPSHGIACIYHSARGAACFLCVTWNFQDSHNVGSPCPWEWGEA